MSVSPLLLRFVDDELARAPELVSRTLASSIERLRHPGADDLAVSDRQQLNALATSLTEHGDVYQVAFVDALRALATAELDPDAAGRLPSPDDPTGALLMDEIRVESDIEISRAMVLIDAVASNEQRELQAFTTTLRELARPDSGDTAEAPDFATVHPETRGRRPHAESNPLRTQTYARALWHAGTAVHPLPALQRAVLLRVSASTMAESLKALWAHASLRLAEEGVPRHDDRPPPRPTGELALNVAQPGALESLLAAMPSAPPLAVPPEQPAPPEGTVMSDPPARSPLAPPAPRGRRDPSLPLDMALHSVEAELRTAPRLSVPRLSDHVAALLAAADDPTDQTIIELVARLFDAILTDPRVPPAFRSPMARLQASALRIALHDPFTLETHKHPVWTLLERIAASSVGMPPGDDARRGDLLSFCETMVDEMARAPVQDTALYWRALARFDAFLADELAVMQRALQSSIDALHLAERIDQMREQISARLVEQMVRVQTQPAIRRFVTGPWAQVLALAMLRYGERSETAIAYMQTVDDLLWTLQIPDHPQSRQKLILMLPGLLQRLRDGMALIDMPEADQQAVFDELVAVHTLALRATPRAPGTPEAPMSPQEVVQRLREESGPVPLTDLPTFKDSLIDLGSLDTVPAEWLYSVAPQAVDAPPDVLHEMTPGQRYRLFLHGRWMQAQLVWRSEHGQFLLFAGDAPGQTHSITQRALGKLQAAHLLLQADDAPPLMQRAMDAVLRGLAVAPAVVEQRSGSVA